MKRKYFLPLLLLLALLIPSVSCEATGNIPFNSTGRFCEVFNTASDAGQMTCRFLYLTEKHPANPTAVRAGDSSIYTSPEGFVMLVDCGNQTSGMQVVESLRLLGIKKIDIFVASHPHADHIGGFTAISNAFEIDRIYMNKHVYDSETYREMIQVIEEKRIPAVSLVEGDNFEFGAFVKVKCYNPPADFNFSNASLAAASIANEGSLCLKMTFGASSFLSSGDMYVGSERRVAEMYAEEIRSDIVKMNHHGDSTSNCTEFITSVHPKMSVAMNEGVLSLVVNYRYQKVDALTFYNCVDGAIKVSTPGDGIYQVQSQFIREIENIGKPSSDGYYIIK